MKSCRLRCRHNVNSVMTPFSKPIPLHVNPEDPATQSLCLT